MSGYLNPDRTQVLCFGFDPGEAEAQELSNRQLIWSRYDVDPDDAQMARARGAWFAMDKAQGSAVVLARLGPRLANHGVLICVTANDDPSQKLAYAGLKPIPAEYRFQSALAERPAYVVPEKIARHDPGPAWNPGFAPKYIGDAQQLTAEDTFLLSRALASQGQVRLEVMDGGMSNARVFSVHTTRGNSFGSWAQPLFVKIDKRERIEEEARNYKFAAPFIPFSLLPNIETVILGASRGVLVGGLVDRSLPLWDAIRTNHADEAISNLFHTTLAGWRGQAIQRAAQPGPMWAALERAGIVAPKRVRPEYYEEFCNQENSLRPQEIAGIMESLPHRYLSGPIHGDLHAGNVRVKGVDAILIDMYSNGEGPMAADVAMLETWIAIALHERDQSPGFNNPEWAEVVEHLYSPEAFRGPVAPIVSGSPLRWLWDSVRLIRSIGLAHEHDDGEYQIAVVAALLRRCMYECKTPADKFRRMTAYRLASRLAAAMRKEGMRNVA